MISVTYTKTKISEKERREAIRLYESLVEESTELMRVFRESIWASIEADEKKRRQLDKGREKIIKAMHENERATKKLVKKYKFLR